MITYLRDTDTVEAVPNTISEAPPYKSIPCMLEDSMNRI